MRRKQNVIIFSAGESVRNGNVDYITRKLEEKDIKCFDWRSLFKQAHNVEQIALLPSLAKKIPTFDFALIVAEGVDTVKLRGDEEQKAIRDNVIFELGLCVMALGVERVILLAEDSVRIPDDLIGVGRIGVEYITFDSDDIGTAVYKLEEILENKMGALEARFATQLDDIINHININSEMISPVFIGAAVSSAEAYFLNFIVRLLENTDKGFYSKNDSSRQYGFPDVLDMKIVIPTDVNLLTYSEIKRYYQDNGYKEYVINDAGLRGLFFYGNYDELNNRLTIVDIPTSITASYAVVNSVLNIDSDEDYDIYAEERFVNKELDVYAFALKKLLCYNVASERLAFIKDTKKRECILQKLNSVSVNVEDITE